MSGTLKRGISHLFCGLFAPLIALFLPIKVVLISLGAITCLFLIIELLRLRLPLVNRWFIWLLKPLLRQEEELRLTGASYMLIASLATLLVFQRDIAILALSFLAIGDAMAAIVGGHIGRVGFLGKTVEGDLTCFISCLATGFIFYHLGLNISLLMVLAGSLGAAVMETVPLPIDDNLTMPLFAGLLMTIVPA